MVALWLVTRAASFAEAHLYLESEDSVASARTLLEPSLLF